MSTSSGGILMSRVSHAPVTQRRITILVVAIFVAITLYAVPHANAESSVTNNPQTNVFLRYGSQPVSDGKYTRITQIYTNIGFENTASNQYGSLKIHKSAISIKLAKGEKIMAIETDYLLSNGTQIHRKWNGKGALPEHYFTRNGLKARLLYLGVGVHSPKLPIQPKPIHVSGMH